MIEPSQVSKRYGRTMAVQGLTFRVGQGRGLADTSPRALTAAGASVQEAFLRLTGVAQR